MLSPHTISTIIQNFLTRYLTYLASPKSKIKNDDDYVRSICDCLNSIALFHKHLEKPWIMLKTIDSMILKLPRLSAYNGARIIHVLVLFKDKYDELNIIFNRCIDALRRVRIDYVLPKYLEDLHTDVGLLTGIPWKDILNQILHSKYKPASMSANYHTKPIMQKITTQDGLLKIRHEKFKSNYHYTENDIRNIIQEYTVINDA